MRRLMKLAKDVGVDLIVMGKPLYRCAHCYQDVLREEYNLAYWLCSHCTFIQQDFDRGTDLDTFGSKLYE